MTAQHSKGPWKHRPICSSEGELIRDEIVNEDGEIIVDDVRRPEDAPVIATAPEMLEALRALVDYGINLRGKSRSYAILLMRGFDAIAKAEGHQ
ncbi:hypothetical protein KL86PLE_90705 [uncultured Pleomorphomonas sp.]|uniref:Uncharacterized protein n=1 Tax=uncultured Pleomorphomonas sp. TaxID=442121 RepID=A0A212LQQ3_9HYPH|nr:hypothetical protein [uncultured Pleomorphomonas sp.]SCM79914.1 hypothetical protein KL86PLE_90705 [uncultured Pleomorphomonas sp.]